MIELIAVIAIIGILVVLVAPNVMSYINEAEEMACDAAKKQVSDALQTAIATGEIAEDDLEAENSKQIASKIEKYIDGNPADSCDDYDDLSDMLDALLTEPDNGKENGNDNNEEENGGNDDDNDENGGDNDDDSPPWWPSFLPWPF
ncbi:type II secretion system protein [Natranaerobius thermophilus]|uniref:Uncharacterized protein n=1 Tax=Natranaerobius thermophilus (strain ATCC BAA-1301 / DSM 18059 / JW/NM-WN-LF) TaxID=457570 RepID=B2A188_NATTJ|nr:hypothetical protein Nther_2464 [Natranaerobius thermophilus JW/NM-WN-LF]